MKAMTKIQKKEIINELKEFFGTTEDIYEAGYLLEDGTKLDFSGKQIIGTKKLECQKLEFCTDGGVERWRQKKFEPGVRTIDHASICHFMPEGKSEIDFIMECNVIDVSICRGTGSFLYLKIGTTPTSKQINALRHELLKVEKLIVVHIKDFDNRYEKENPRPLDLQTAISRIIG